MSGVKLITFLLCAALIGAAHAQAEDEGITPSAISRRLPPGADFSCAHFRARVKDDQQAIGELLWHLDKSADPEQLKAYFANRLAADPQDIAVQRVADVKWSIPVEQFPQGGQVASFIELTREDFSGAQMEFDVKDREVVPQGGTVRVRSPVRMVDVCMKGYVDLNVYSECPVEQLTFWHPTPAAQSPQSMIVPPYCAKIQTVRLSLAGVESFLAQDKQSASRGSAKSVNLPMASGPLPCAGEDVKAAALLENLRGIRRVHNCEIDVVEREKGDNAEFSIYARDLYACKTSLYACLESEVSFKVPKACMSGAGVSPSFKFVSGATLTSGDFAAELSAQLNREGQLMQLRLSHIDRTRGTRSDFVNCVPDIMRRKNVF